MKTYIELDVDLVDLDTFEIYPGGEEFSVEFGEWAVSRLRFRFPEGNILEKAKKILSGYNIRYMEYSGVILESDLELSNYPLVIIAFNSQYNVLSKKDGQLVVNRAVARKAINNDIELGNLVVQKKAKLFLEEKTTNISFDEIPDEKGKSTLFLASVPILKTPRIIDEENGIQDLNVGDDIFYQPIELDGRYKFPKESILELNHNPMLRMKSFSVNGKLFETPKSIYIIKGSLALAFKETFDFDKENISLVIPPLDIV